MKLTCLQENLKRGLSIVGHAVAGKSTLPVLSNVLFATDNGRLKLAATNLELGITCWIGSKIDREGAVTIPAKLMSDLVGSLPNDRIVLELDSASQSVKITCTRYDNNIIGLDAELFPTLPSLDEREPIAVFACEILREAIDQIAFAAATDDSRPVLTGVLVRLRDNQCPTHHSVGNTRQRPRRNHHPSPRLDRVVTHHCRERGTRGHDHHRRWRAGALPHRRY
jgi:DNA polymerase-3 subunit beta